MFMEDNLKNNKTVLNTNKTEKRDRFVRIVERRVNNIFDALDSLGKCANKRNYEYGEDDVKRIFSAIDKKIKDNLYKETKMRVKNMNKDIGTDWIYPSDVGNMSAHDVDDARASKSVRCYDYYKGIP